MRVDVRELKRHVVRIEDAVGRVLGTGFFVAPGVVLSCAHIVKGESTVRLRLASDLDRRSVDGDVVVRSDSPQSDGGLWPFPDLAVIRAVELGEEPCVLLAGQDPVGEDECVAWGFPRREDEIAPMGSTASFRWEGPEGDEYLKLKAGQSAPGLSGAPLICPTKRAVVGVVAGTRGPDSDLGAYASPVGALLFGGPGVPNELVVAGEEIGRRNRPAVVAVRASWNRVVPVEDADGLLEQPWGRFSRQKRSVPSDLLRADYGIVPYLFRERELAETVAWCETDTPMAVMQLAGRGGTGKTRFAIELCKQLEPRGWVTGLWRPGGSVTGVPLPRLVVIDYAEDVDTLALDDELDALERRATDLAPVRVLLLTRTSQATAVDPLSTLRGNASARLKTILDAGEDSNLGRAGLNRTERSELFHLALARFNSSWYGSPASDDLQTAAAQAVIDLDDERYAVPLDVLFEALDATLAGESETRLMLSPVDRALAHEERYWRMTAPVIPELDESTRRQCVALATLAGAKDDSEADVLLSLLDTLTGPKKTGQRRQIQDWLSELYEGPGRLNPLHPDRLGEALIAHVLREDSDLQLLPRVLALSSTQQISRALEVLVRVSAAYPDITDATGSVLLNAHPNLVRLAIWAHESAESEDLAGSLARLFTGTLSPKVAELLQAQEPENTALARDLGVSYGRLGDLARAVGEVEQAERLYRQGLAIRMELARRDPTNIEYQRDLGVSYDRLGDLARAAGGVEQAERLYRQGLAIRMELARRDPTNTEYQHDLGVSYDRLGDLARAAGGVEQAERLYRQGLAIRMELARRDPTNTEYQHDLGVSYDRLGDLARAAGEVEQAERLFRQGLAIRMELARRDPTNTEYQRNLGVSYDRLGDLARAAGEVEQAERLFRQGLAIDEELARRDPTNTEYQRDLSVSYNRLGDLARAAGEVEQAERLYRQGLAIRMELARRDPTNTEYQRGLSVSYNRLGDLARAAGEVEQAERLYRQGLAITEELARRDPTNIEYQRDLSASYDRLGDLARAAGEVEQAERLYRQGLAIDEELTRRDPTNTEYQRNLGVSYNKLGDLARAVGGVEQAERFFRQGLAITEELARRDPTNIEYQRDLRITYGLLDQLAHAQGKPEEAEHSR